MPNRRAAFSWLVLAALAAMAACAPPAPYAYKQQEFNRALPSFVQPNAGEGGIEICYNKLSTTPEALTRMASEHCAGFGKTARFARQDYLECPLMTPARAAFHCVQ